MDGHGTHHQRHHGVGGNTQRQQRDERGLRTSVVGRLGSRHTADIALAERHFTGLELGLLLDRVGSKSRQQSTTTGQDTQGRAQGRTADHRGQHALEVFLGGEQAGHLGSEHFALIVRLRQVGNDFAVTEHTHGDHHEVDTVGQFRNVERVTCHTGVHVGTYQTQQQAQHDHAHGLEQRARSQHHGTDQAQHHQREVFGRAELEGHFGQRRSEGSQNQRAHAAREERADTGRRKRWPRSPFSGHLVAVNHGHHRRGFTWQIHQNGGGRTAVLCAVINTSQHDQRRHRRQCVGGRQQHGDGGHGAHARQHADQRTQQTADEAVDQVLESECDAKARRQILYQVHVLVSPINLQ
ncbi:hypothetical protein SDC9_73909 [bioreactor metagenome]|uniref:Uncharacterized protein n=1 Tax=bioreactor metagenome TaxID=1076179 RepID=A0A644YHC5_9ZZZZ